MQTLNLNQTECGHCALSRRSFLATGCAGCAGMIGLSQGGLLLEVANAAETTMTVRVIFSLHAPVQTDPDWPNIGFDFRPVMDKTMNALILGCPNIAFKSSMADGLEKAKQIVDTDKAEGTIDGYFVMQLNTGVRAVQEIVASGKPVLYTDFLYGGCGHFLQRGAAELRAGKPNYAFISSSQLEDYVAAAQCFPLAKGEGGVAAFVAGVTKVRIERTPNHFDMTCKEDKVDMLSTADLRKELKGKKMLEVEKGRHAVAAQTKESLGIEIVQIPYAELNDEWVKADKDAAQEVVKRWKRTADAIVGVPDKTLQESAEMYLAQKACLKKYDACAITVNCLHGFYGGQIHAYPCLGFHELLNEGLVGACECDTRSTLTMVAMTTLTKGRPGFISDPVMDISTKQIIYAHCVASNKPFGPAGPANPFTILTHSEDRQGASVRSTLPPGYMTTTLEIAPEWKQILFHQAKAVGNSTEDRACRTKLACVPAGDFEKLFTCWAPWSWHRVTYYGDLKESVFALADAIGFKVIEEA